MDTLLGYLPMAVAVIGAVFGFFFKSRAKQAQDIAEIARTTAVILTDSIERGRNAESSGTPDSVKGIVQGIMSTAPPAVRTWFLDLKRNVVGD